MFLLVDTLFSVDLFTGIVELVVGEDLLENKTHRNQVRFQLLMININHKT